MKILKSFLAVAILTIISTNAQNTVVNSEIGIFLGPAFMQTDYGEAKSFSSSSSNVGFNFGAAYIIDLSDSRYSSNFLQGYADLVKTRIELSYSKASLEYDGKPIEGPNADLFKAMEGETKIFNFGVLQEINFMSITKNATKLKPYGLLGIHYTIASPDLSTSESSLPSIFSPLDENVFMEKQNTFSWTAGVGTRYQLDDVDLFIEMRYHNFFSDRIDGLDTNISDDKKNDNQIVFNIGAIFKLDSRSK